MTLRIGVIFFLVFRFCWAYAQQDTLSLVPLVKTIQQDSVTHSPRIYTLGEIELIEVVKGNHLNTRQDWGASELTNSGSINVSDLLQKSSNVYVKSYGSGGLATVSLRGTGAGRSSTIWNGMPLIGSTLGLLDYSLLNANLFESLSLNLVGDAGRYGSGSIGGNMLLNNQRPEDAESLSIKSVLGSYGRYHQGLKYSLSKEKWWSSTRMSFETAKEDFSYRIREDLPEKVNTNAARKQISILQSFGLDLNERNAIGINIWAQDNLREIPPTTVQTRSEAEVLDKTLRLQGLWSFNHSKKLKLKTIAAASYNQNEFVDPLNLVFGDNVFKQIYLKSTADFQLREGKWSLGASNRYTQANTNNYQVEISQNQFALFSQFQRSLGEWYLYVSLREELIDDQLNPLSGMAMLQRMFNNKWHFKISANRHFRIPALNDLYWAPGGNANLKPENGWSQELALSYQNKSKWKAGINIYNHNIQNWIQWGLLDGSNFYSALNLPQVWSRGIDSHLNMTWGRKDNSISLQLSYNYNLATYEFSLKNPLIVESDQVFYTPVHQGTANLSWEKAKYAFTYSHRYQSGITTFLEPLEGFHMGNLHARYMHKRLSIFVEVNNLWDVSYRVIERRPMPGRNYNIGINIEILNKNKR